MMITREGWNALTERAGVEVSTRRHRVGKNPVDVPAITVSTWTAAFEFFATAGATTSIGVELALFARITETGVKITLYWPDLVIDPVSEVMTP